MNQVICITGMHRSGTSLVASWLESSGLVIHDGAFLGPSVGNEKGNFEDADSLLFNIGDLIANSHASFNRINSLLENNLSQVDFGGTFDGALFNGRSIYPGDYGDLAGSIESMHAELTGLSEKC